MTTENPIKILLCTDGSRNSLAAVSMGGRLASALNADTTLFAAGVRGQRVYKALDRARQTLNTFNINPKTLVGIGQPISQFAKQVQQIGYDLVVIGYRKRKAWEKALAGSAATKVVNRATTSTLVVREGRQDIRRILIGIGGNGFTAELAKWGAVIAAAVGAQVTLIHVESAPPLMYAGLEEVHQTLTEFLETDTPAAHALRRAADILNLAGVSANIKLARGVAERELLRTAQYGDYDLVMLGSSWARPALDRLIMQNVTRNILLHTNRPVLVVYPAAARPSSDS